MDLVPMVGRGRQRAGQSGGDHRRPGQGDDDRRVTGPGRLLASLVRGTEARDDPGQVTGSFQGRSPGQLRSRFTSIGGPSIIGWVIGGSGHAEVVMNAVATMQFTVNGQRRAVTTDPDRPLLDVL